MNKLIAVISLILLLPSGGYLAAINIGKSLSHQARTANIDSVGSFIAYLVVGAVKSLVMLVGAVFGSIYVAIFDEQPQPAIILTIIGAGGLVLAYLLEPRGQAHY